MFVRKLAAKRVAWLSLSTLVATGCAAIVGADDYKVDPNATTGSGASGGSGGSTVGTGGRGGSAGTAIPDGGTGGSTGGAAGATGGKGGTSGTGGAPTGGAAGTGGTAGAGATGSGESICTGATCPAGQTCLMTFYSPPGLCTTSCATTACDAQHLCVFSDDPSDMFPASCLKKCTTRGATCPPGLLCLPTNTENLCFPTGWVDNKPNGWCAKPCGAADALCAHDSTNFPNRNGELNWCVSNAGALTCVPGCDSDMTICPIVYPGTACKAIVDITGSAQYACLP